MLEDKVLKDPHSSPWLRAALRSALACDPVHVANEAQYLLRLLQDRAARLTEVSEVKFPEEWIPNGKARRTVKASR